MVAPIFAWLMGAPSLKVLITKIFNTPLDYFIVMLQMFIWINLEAMFPVQSVDLARSLMVAYMIFTMAFAVSELKQPDEVQSPFPLGLANFLVGFGTFAAVLISIPLSIGTSIFGLSIQPLQFAVPNLTAAVPYLLIFAFVIAYPEEKVFRLSFYSRFGPLIASVLFGFWHLFAYSGNTLSMVLAMLFGVIFSYVANKYNFMLAVGMHTAWNLKLLGAY